MIIGITGYGYSGASAYLDVLKEFSGVQSFPEDFEFQIVQKPDGLLDLMNGLVFSKRRLYCNTIINRFKNGIYSYSNSGLSKKLNGKFEEISERYIDSLIELTWEGRSNYDPDDIRVAIDRKKYKFLNRIIGGVLRQFQKSVEWPPNSNRYFSFLSEEEFLSATRSYINELLDAAGFNKKDAIVLEQVFCTSDPLSGAEFFDDDVLSLIIDRDPRDVYILTNHVFPEKCRFMPNKGDVELFIKYYKLLHYNRVEDKRVCYLRYEDLIYNYSKTVKQLEELIGIKNTAARTVFKPEISINNTQLYKERPQISKAIEKIENSLGDFCYNFEEAEKFIDFDRQKVTPF